jgi:hypothetical protein
MSMILVPNREAIARLERARAAESAEAEEPEPKAAAGETRAAGES